MKDNTMEEHDSMENLSEEQVELLTNIVKLALHLGHDDEDFEKYVTKTPPDNLLTDLTLMLFAAVDGMNGGVNTLIRDCYDVARESHSREAYVDAMIDRLNEHENIGLESVKIILRIAFRSVKRLSLAMDAAKERKNKQ